MSDQRKIHSIHFLRFLAAFAVVVHHATYGRFGNYGNGAVGVDIFFVISGIVIGLQLTSQDSPYEFGIKRLIRILPMYWFGTVLYIASGFIRGGGLPESKDFIKSLVLWPEFGTSFHLIYWPAWTLDYEIFFYAVAYISLILFSKQARPTVLIFLGALLAIRIPIPGKPHDFFVTEYYLEFIAGIFISIGLENSMRLGKTAGIACILIAIAIVAPAGTFSLTIRSLSWGIPAVMLICGALAFENARWLRSRWVEICGNASYAIYMTHLTVIEFISGIANAHHALNKGSPIIWIFILVGSSIAIGVASFICVEQPILRFFRSVLIKPKFIPQQPNILQG